MPGQKLKVEGMSCGHCVATIQKAIGCLSGVSSVNVNLNDKEVFVEFDENKLTLGIIASKIKEAGFDVVS